MTERRFQMLLQWVEDRSYPEEERWLLLFGGVPVGVVERDEDGSYYGAVPVFDTDEDADPTAWTEAILEPDVDAELTLEQSKELVTDHVLSEMRAAIAAGERSDA